MQQVPQVICSYLPLSSRSKLGFSRVKYAGREERNFEGAPTKFGVGSTLQSRQPEESSIYTILDTMRRIRNLAQFFGTWTGVWGC